MTISIKRKTNNSNSHTIFLENNEYFAKKDTTQTTQSLKSGHTS